MPLTVNELTKERQLVLLCSRGVLKDEHIEDIKEILSDRLDWKEILYQGITHRTLNMMYYHLDRLGLTHKIEEEVLKAMKSQSKAYAVRNKVYFGEIKKIFEILNSKGVRAAILKGNFLSANVYPSIETRTFNDIDLLMDLKDEKVICQTLEELGYVQGQYNEVTKEIIPVTRKQKMFHLMSTGELQVFLKKMDNPFAPLAEVDLNYNILWKGHCPYRIDTAGLLERAVEADLDGGKIYTLNYEDFLIQLAFHLYKEAVNLLWISDLRDLKIYKFVDVAIFVEKFTDQIDWDKLVKFSIDNDCSKIPYYTFYYVNLMYGDVIPQAVMKALEPDNKDYLDEYGIDGEKPSKWKFDFFTRLFETSRVLELSDDAMLTKNKFIEKKNKVM
ncbi:MAG: nucleotidyltransferase domain-containing protein [Bacillota bacterium]